MTPSPAVAATSPPARLSGRAIPAAGQIALYRRILLAAFAVTHVAMVAHIAWVKSPSVDEVAHLAAGLSHVRFGTFDLYRVNPPLHRLPAGVALAMAGVRMDWSEYRPGYVDRREFDLGATLARLNADRYRELVFLARLACLPWTLLGLGLCYVWARDLYGPEAGLLAAGLWAFCPELIAHGAMVTPDLAGASFGLLAGYAWWRWLRLPDWLGATLAGFALGLAWLAKFTWVVVLPVLWPLLALLWLVQGPFRFRTWAVRTVQVAMTFLVAWSLFNLGYGFERTFRPLGKFGFRSEALGGEAASAEGFTGNRFRRTPLEALPVPLPRNVVLGIDVQKGDFEADVKSYLAGQWRENGWWYYYAYAWGVKLPLGLLVLMLAALVHGRPRLDEWALIAPAAALFVFVSSETGFSHHPRYVLPALPFLIVFVSRLVRRPHGLGSSVRRTIVGAAFAWVVAASLWIHPHHLSYFNELAGGPRNGHAHLTNSGVDWGQDLWLLKDWLDENRRGRPLGLAYFGGFLEPTWFGIEHNLPPSFTPPDSESGKPAEGEGPRPGLYAVSVNFLRGLHFTVPVGQGKVEGTAAPRWTYFLDHFKPVAMAGYSIYIYDLSPEEVRRARQKMGLPPLSE